ncbi:hypothetical protein ACEWY4_004481 [Coilia grayii]|uniref:Uncharacterized protein n=1 Tax=Coilia grayii TaxID=363190 RepID=A0ABD1KLN4_9TELE
MSPHPPNPITPAAACAELALRGALHRLPDYISNICQPFPYSQLDDKVLELFKEGYEADITELKAENKRLQDDLHSCRTSQLGTEQENKQLKGTITTLKNQNKDMEEKIKLLNKNVSENLQTHTGTNDMVTIQIEMESCPKKPELLKAEGKVPIAQDKLTAVEHKIYELENKEMAYKTRMKSSALQRQLMDKRTEVFFLHHKLMDYMDWVAKLRGTRFVPLPLYPHNQKPTHKRVRDGWRTFLTQTRLHVIPEERGDCAPNVEPRMAATNAATFHLY